MKIQNFNNIHRLARKTLLPALLSAVLMLTGTACAVDTTPLAQDKINEAQLFAMDTVMDIQIAGDEALLQTAQQKIQELENSLSVTREGSDIYNVNDSAGAAVSKETYDIVSQALSMCKETDGALDISIYPVLKAYGFTGDEHRVPEPDELERLLGSVDYTKVSAVENTDGTCYIDIPENFKIDLGSVVKGYTGTLLANFFKENGVKSGLINLGGNVECIGNKPDGSAWKVGIKSPFLDSKTGVFGVIEASDVAIVTSGGYERYFEENGEIYWHIIDPATGKPAKNGLVSVTMVGTDGLKCDALSTALFVKGLDGAIEYLKAHQEFDAVLITEGGEAYVTSGIADNFRLSNEYSSAPIHVIEK